MAETDDSFDGGSPSLAGNEGDDVKIRKRRERLEQNRISARESRKRKKNMIEELQRTVITLSREHKELSQRNETLKQQMMELSQKVSKKMDRERLTENHVVRLRPLSVGFARRNKQRPADDVPLRDLCLENVGPLLYSWPAASVVHVFYLSSWRRHVCASFLAVFMWGHRQI